MKKVFLGLALVAGSLSFAQQFGAKAGLNMSSLSKDGYESAKSKAGFYAGVFMNAPLAENFSIQPEVIYNNLGATVTKSETKYGKYDQKLNLNYISVPVMFQYNATPEFYLEAGPEFSFIVGASSKSTFENKLTDDVSKTFKELDKDNFNSFNFGMGLGLGYNITPNIGVNARYVAGFTNINKDGVTSLNNDKNKNRNNTFQVGLGLKF